MDSVQGVAYARLMATTDTAAFGIALKEWRTRRRMSQLDLAAAAEVSQRHLSFLETARARPSREMVIHLSSVLDVPIRERNTLLNAAGFAATYPSHGLGEPAMEQVRHVLDLLLEAHRPFPAYVVDRRWDLVMTNQPAMMLTAMLVDPSLAATFGGNVARLSLHPDGIRQHLVNWEEFAAELLHRLEREIEHRPGDDALADLMDEVRAFPDVASLPRRAEAPTGTELLVPVHVRTPERELRLFTTIATIGAPYDITLEELRLETLLPADRATEDSLREMASAG